LLIERARVCCIELDETGIERGEQDAIAPEAGVNALSRERRLNHQAGAHHHENRNRHLHNDERRPQVEPAGQRFALLLEDPVHARR
jgi:hypothetical protein